MNMREKGMQKRTFIAVAAAAVIVVAALVLILALGGREDTYRSIKIIELGGGVTIEREGVGILEASSNMNLISGDAVKTGQDAYAVLQLDSDKYVMLAESGSMTVVAEGEEANSRTAIRLDAGSVLSEIQNPLSSGSSYDIVTPNATMSVRGTVFEVRKNGDDSTGDIEVLVYDGKVAVGLGDAEPVLYEAGQYTQFTAGQNPQFIIERTEISEEYLDPQFMERLEQIDSQSRALNLGTAQLALAKTPEETAEPQQTPAVVQSTATPAPTVTPVPTATPAAPTPAATPKPAKTPAPQAAVQTPEVTAPMESPAAEVPEPEQNDDDDQPAPPAAPVQPEPPVTPVQPPQNPGEGNGNTGDSGNTGDGGNDQGAGSWDLNDKQNFWKKYTLEDYKQATAGNPAAGTTCTVFYYVPEIIVGVEDPADSSKSYSALNPASPTCISTQQVTVGDRLTRPADPVEEKGLSLTFAGWYLEGNSALWDFDTDTVEANMCLYAVWTDAEGKSYYPVIARSEKQSCYYCNSVKEGTCLTDNILNVGGNREFLGWERILNGGLWDFDTDTVQGAELLKASWSD